MRLTIFDMRFSFLNQYFPKIPNQAKLRYTLTYVHFTGMGDGYNRQRCIPKKELFPPSTVIPKNPTIAECISFYHGLYQNGYSRKGNLRACAEKIKTICNPTETILNLFL